MMIQQRGRQWPIIAAMTGIVVMPLAACTQSSAPIASTPLPAASSVHQLGAGDKVRINVYGEPQLSGEFQVSGAGTLNLPLVGSVSAAGLTVEQLGALLIQRYGNGLLNNPRIVAELLDLRPFSVLGEVSRPGQYPLRDGLTLLEAVALAGGYTYRANQNRIYVRRAGEQVEHLVEPGQNPIIAPGDIVRVGERYF